MNQKFPTKITLLLATMLISSLLLMGNGIYGLSKMDKLYKSQIGKSVIVNNDTLRVVDYTLILEQFKLSDGQTISGQYLEILLQESHPN